MPIATRSICVFCGARNGHDPVHATAALDTGNMIARQGWRLVYGAGDVGLMGLVAEGAHKAGAETFGVIPTHLMGRERARETLSTMVVTSNMHERKTVMFMNSDAIVVLPGGAGSLDEFFEVLTWRQIGLHSKPIFLLDVNGYWQPLMGLIDHVVAHGFAEAGIRDFIELVPDVATLEQRLKVALD